MKSKFLRILALILVMSSLLSMFTIFAIVIYAKGLIYFFNSFISTGYDWVPGMKCLLDMEAREHASLVKQPVT